MEKLPESITLTFNGGDESFETKATLNGSELVLGRVEYDEDDEAWDFVYGDDMPNASNRVGGIEGPFEAVGHLLDNAYSTATSADDDDEDPDEDKDPDEADVPTDGRQWVLISRAEDCVVHAMEILRSSTDGPATIMGSLLRVEVWGDDDGEYTSSIDFIPAVSVADLKIDPEAST